jgi:hypothetical protein
LCAQNFEEVQQNHSKQKENIDARRSERGGLAGLFETVLRRARLGTSLFALALLYLIMMLTMAVSATPGVYWFFYLLEHTAAWAELLRYGALAFGIISGYFLYGLTIIFVAPLFNFLMPFRLRPFRGIYYSLETVPWYFHNAFTYVVRYSFLDYFTPSPLNLLFYRLMGMKMGKGCQINTTNISDPALIELGDKVTIGGSATIFGHYATQGYLIVDKVKIGSGVTIGLKATIMGDVEIGDGAVIAPHEVVYPKARIPAGRRPSKQNGGNGSPAPAGPES